MSATVALAPVIRVMVSPAAPAGRSVRAMSDALRHHAIRESTHRILDPFTDEQLATLGRALHLEPGATVLDLACGKGELLCTWARDHGIVGTGVDLNPPFVEAARERAASLGVDVELVLADASG